MSGEAHKPGADALKALLDRAPAALGEKEYATAAGLLVKKILNAAGQTLDDIRALRDTVGHDIFEAQLKSLTAHQARLLARRLDRDVPDIEVSTAGAACAWIRGLLDGAPAAAPEAPAPETPAEAPAEAAAEPDAAASPAAGAYFGRRSFRTNR